MGERITTEEAKAVTAVANTTNTALEVARDSGGWMASVLDDLPKNLVGMPGDYVQEKRRRNLARITLRSREILAPIERKLAEPSLSVVLPLYEAAFNESRPELQELWATLLANAMLSDRSQTVRRSYFETVKKMEPADARVLAFLYRVKRLARGDARMRSSECGVPERDFLISLDALIALGVLACPLNDIAYLTPFGEVLFDACCPPGISAQP